MRVYACVRARACARMCVCACMCVHACMFKNHKPLDYTEGGDETSDDQETILVLTEFEENIRNNILSGDGLTKETLDAILMPWWKEEPYMYDLFIYLFRICLLYFSFNDFQPCLTKHPPCIQFFLVVGEH